MLRNCEIATNAARKRDRDAQQTPIKTQLAVRRALTQALRRVGLNQCLNGEAGLDPHQAFVAPADDLTLSRARLVADPALILEHVSKTEAEFTRIQVLRVLAKRIDDPLALRDTTDRAMTSPDLVRLGDGRDAVHATRDYLADEGPLQRTAATMAAAGGFGVARHHTERAMHTQDMQMQRAFGGRLSADQRAALDHALGDRRFACVVGLAGACKSTMLATAMEAWSRQGLTVRGEALAGKAAGHRQSQSATSGMDQPSGICNSCAIRTSRDAGTGTRPLS